MIAKANCQKIDIKIGADPELFLYNTSSKQYVSAHDIIPGNKHNPVRVPRGAIQVDGVAAEFNIDPASNMTQFISNIKHVRRLLDFTVKRKSEYLELRASPVAVFDLKMFSELPDNVKALGCEPDFDAYTGDPNPKPETDEPFRTGAGHIHIGWTHDADPHDQEHFFKCTELVRELDFVLYNSSLQWDTDDKRRELYGKPGAFRPKSYGLEYRVLSNAWLNEIKSQMFVFAASKSVAVQFFKGNRFSDRYKFDRNNPDAFNDILKNANLPSYNSYGM